MELTIKIDLDNAAFEDGRDQELERIFFRIRERLSFAGNGRIDNAPIYDSNGNTAGHWRVVP